MVLVSIFVSFCIDPIFLLVNGEVPPTLIRSAIRICLIPLIVGLGYELIKIAGKYDNFITRNIYIKRKRVNRSIPKYSLFVFAV